MDGIYQTTQAPVTVDSYQYSEPVQTSVPTQTVTSVSPSKQQGNQTPAEKQGRKEPTTDEIKSAITSANRRAHFGHTNAEFSYHEPTKRISVKIIDKETNEVIREIPPEETLEMISKMWELAGIMVDEKR